MNESGSLCVNGLGWKYEMKLELLAISGGHSWVEKKAHMCNIREQRRNFFPLEAQVPWRVFLKNHENLPFSVLHITVLQFFCACILHLSCKNCGACKQGLIFFLPMGLPSVSTPTPRWDFPALSQLPRASNYNRCRDNMELGAGVVHVKKGRVA